MLWGPPDGSYSCIHPQYTLSTPALSMSYAFTGLTKHTRTSWRNHMAFGEHSGASGSPVSARQFLYSEKWTESDLVLSHSGSFYWKPEEDGEHKWLAHQFASRPVLPLRFHLKALLGNPRRVVDHSSTEQVADIRWRYSALYRRGALCLGDLWTPAMATSYSA